MIREILAVLFPCIVILYFIDSIQYINKTHMLFVNHVGKKYYLKKSGIHISKLSPFGTTILSHNMPVCFTISGLYKINHKESYEKAIYEADDFYFISYQNIDKVEVEGKEVRINGKNCIKAPSSISANIIKDIIYEIKTIKPTKRIKKIQKFFEETLDIERIAALNHSYSNYLINLKIFSAFFFLNTFIILPSILYSNVYLYINIYLVVAYIFLTYITILIMTFFVHRKIYKAEKKQRIYSILSLIFSPVSAMHATNYITTDLYAHFNYLAIAKLLLPLDIFISLVRKELHLIEHRKHMIDNSDWCEYWELRKQSLTNLIKKADYTIKRILEAPSKQDENAICYCPICLTEYISDVGKCRDCGKELEKY